MKDTIDALELLTEQHDEVEELLSRIEDSDDSDEREELFRQVADKIAAHSTMEEKIFYPSVMSEQTSDMLLESMEAMLTASADFLGGLPVDRYVFLYHFEDPPKPGVPYGAWELPPRGRRCRSGHRRTRTLPGRGAPRIRRSE